MSKELKAIKQGSVELGEYWVYDAEDVDALLAEKDAAIAELKQKLEDVQATAYAESVDAGMRERRLRRALYKACENWAWAEHVRYVDISDGSQGYKQAQERWDKMASKCRAKAEEYK